MNLLVNDILTVPLYHGTSSLFQDSIITHGLGAVNPLENLKVFPFLKQVNTLCEEVFGQDENHPWQTYRLEARKMLDQEITNAGYNFRHGSTYVTANELTAVRYANNNYFGSEILSKSVNFYNLLVKQKVAVSQYSVFQESPIFKLLKQQYYPILIKINNVNINILKSESGGAGECARRQVSAMQQCEPDIFGMLNQQFNFELIQPIRCEELKLYKIEILTQDKISPEYELREIQL